MINKKGLSSNIRTTTSSVPVSPIDNNYIKIGRVVDVILTPDFPDINNYGGVNAIGSIFFKDYGFASSNISIAKPFFPHQSNPPLVNELVLLFYLPNTQIGSNTTEKTYYYINNINIWNSPHHNAYPDVNQINTPKSNQKSYQETSLGSPNVIPDEEFELNLNSPSNPTQDTFVEKANIKPLIPFAGDNIYQGRFGNSIRLGNTANNEFNNWSTAGENGDPITILRNGQDPNLEPVGFPPITEDINKDQSSIYLTSTQKLPLELANNKFDSHSNPPEETNQYKLPQIALNSDRIVLNSKKDHTILSSIKSVSLTSPSINLDSNNIFMDAKTIKLGNKNATESIVKGDTLYRNLKLMVDTLKILVDVLEVQQVWPGGVAAPDGATSITAASTRDVLNSISKDLKNILSTVCKTA